MSGPLLAQAALPRDITLRAWLLDAASWTGQDGILASLLDTLLLDPAADGARETRQAKAKRT